MQLSASQRRYLRGLAHALKPVILTGSKGVTPALLSEFAGALDQHELVKVRLAGEDRAARDAQIEALAAGTGAVLVQHIGRTAAFYRRNAQRPRLALPR
jgi:RNA-binding protein